MILRKFSTEIDTLYLKNKILKNEPKIIKKYPPLGFYKELTDGDTGLGQNSLTSRFFQYNLLDWWGTTDLRKTIKKNYLDFLNMREQDIFVQCWANVMRDGDKIKPHNHSQEKKSLDLNMVSGNLFIYCDKVTKTYYQNQEILNETGDMVLFPSHILHSTDKYVGCDCRISIAFDIRTKKCLELDVHPDAHHHWKKI